MIKNTVMCIPKPCRSAVKHGKYFLGKIIKHSLLQDFCISNEMIYHVTKRNNILQISQGNSCKLWIAKNNFPEGPN